MAPTLRSSSRAASQNNSRPVTPANPPGVTGNTAQPTARPQKQRKTGPRSKQTTAVAANTEPRTRRKTPSARTKKSAGNTPDAQDTVSSEEQDTETTNTNTPQDTAEASSSANWEEPPTFQENITVLPDARRVKIPKAKEGEYVSVLGLPPHPKDARKAQRQPRSTGNIEGSKRHILKLPVPKLTSTPASEMAGLSNTNTPLRDGAETGVQEDHSTGVTRSNTAGPENNVANNDIPEPMDTEPTTTATIIDTPPAAAAGSSNGINHNHVPTYNQNPPEIAQRLDQEDLQAAFASLDLPGGLTVEKIHDILDSAIKHAAETEDPKVAAGLRQIKADCATDPFLLSIVGKALFDPANQADFGPFKSVMKAATKRAQEATALNTEPAADMARTISSSSLSTAQSFEVPKPATTTNEPAAVAGPSSTKGKGKQRTGKSTAAAAATKQGKKRKHNQIQSVEHEITDDAIAAKKQQLKANNAPINVRIREANSRSRRPGSIPFVTRYKTPDSVGPEVEYPYRPSFNAYAHYKPAALADQIDNNDFCSVCGGEGDLLCCDGCVDSFHFTCLDPPMDPQSPPEGEWHCPGCTKKGPLGAISELIDSTVARKFELPATISGYFKDVHVGKLGVYESHPDVINPKNLPERSKDPLEHRLRQMEKGGKVVFCSKCGLTSGGRLEMLTCDGCKCTWHIDCLEPPATYIRQNAPGQNSPHLYWKCPNHVEHLFGDLAPELTTRFRRPRHPKYVDVDIIPEEGDAGYMDPEIELEGTVVRVPERGVIKDFVRRVKRDHIDALNVKAWSDARTQALTDFVARQATGVPNHLDSAEEEAVVGLVSLSQPLATRYGTFISNLVAGAAEGSVSDSTNELEMLRSIQTLVDQRVRDLSSN